MFIVNVLSQKVNSFFEKSQKNNFVKITVRLQSNENTQQFGANSPAILVANTLLCRWPGTCLPNVCRFLNGLCLNNAMGRGRTYSLSACPIKFCSKELSTRTRRESCIKIGAEWVHTFLASSLLELARARVQSPPYAQFR